MIFRLIKPIQFNRIRFLSTSPIFNSNVEKFRRFNPQEGYIWKSGYEQTAIPDLTFDQYIWKDISKWQNHTAFECSETHRSYTYAELRDACAVFGIRLQKQFKLKPGDMIALVLNNIPEYPIGMLGAIEAGLTVTTVNPAYTAEEIARQISISQPKVILSIPECYSKVQKACVLSKVPATTVVVKKDDQERLPAGAIDFYELINTNGIDFSDLKVSNRNPDDVCLVPFSSGTTGLPKGVMLTHRNLIADEIILHAKLPNEGIFQPTTADYQENMLCFLPMFHMAGLVAAIVTRLRHGFKSVTMPTFTADQFQYELMEHKPAVLIVVPTIFMMMANHPGISEKHLENLRTIICGASTIGEGDVKKLLEKKPSLEFIQVYGMTETTALSSITHKNNKNFKTVGSCGVNVEMKIVKENDSNAIGLDANEFGEILIRGPNVMKGYYKNVEATKQALLPDGWLRTGDGGFYDQDGCFYMTDRLKELIKVKGFQVAPAELEEILRTHPMILEAGVVGINHPKTGEVPKAFVVCKPGSEVSEKELQDYVSEKVAPYKRLDGGVHFLTSLPKTSTGKIDRKELRMLL